MQTAVEKLAGLECQLKVTIPAQEVDKAYQTRLKKVVKTAKVDGFRPGKVPAEVIEQRFGRGLSQEVAGELMEKNFEKAVTEEKLRIAGSPTVVDTPELKKGEAFEFVAKFEVYPEIELKDLTGIAIDKKTAEVKEDDVAKMLEKIRKQHAKWEDVDRAVADGERVIIDFEGFIDDKAFEGGKAEDFQLEIGSKQMIPGFEEGLIGVKAADEKEIKVTFPKDYQSEDLAGKEATFKIKVHKVQAPELPELNDEFAKKIGIEKGIDGLREDVQSNMQRELKQVLWSQLKDQVLEKLIEQNEILLPKAMVEAEIDHLQGMTRSQIENQNPNNKFDVSKIDLPRDPYIKDAEKRVALGLLLSEVIKTHDMKADEDRVRSKIEEIAGAYQKKDEVINWYYNNKKMLSEVEAAVLEDQVIDKLLEQASVTEKAITYQEAIAAEQNAAQASE